MAIKRQLAADTKHSNKRNNVYQRLRGDNGVEKSNKKCAKEFKEEAVVLERDQSYSVS
jgi:hypothetical protein